MTAVITLLAIPFGAVIALALLRSYKVAALVNVAATGATLLTAIALLFEPPFATDLVFIDDFNVYLIVLTCFVGFTTSIFSASYIGFELRARHLRRRHLRFYHAMYQGFLFSMLLSLVANNVGVMWVSVEGATLATALMVSLYRTHAAIEAAWKYFILCGVGIALALFGTILIYLAAQSANLDGMDAMAWSKLMASASGFDPAILNVAFVFLFIGYGTKVGLVPLHAWLPDAHSEGPTPISAVLSGLLLNVALYAVLRFKMLLAANGHAIAPGPLMIGMGALSLSVAAAMLYRRKDIKRLFAYSSIEHMGIIVFAFGIGGPVANFAGVLHMTMHSLTKSAIFFAVGHIAQVKETQSIKDIRGIATTYPLLGWGFVLAVLAIAGAPPFGIFMSEFLIVTATAARYPLLAIPLTIGLLVAFGALLWRLQGLAFGPAEGERRKIEASLAPMFAHLTLVMIAGLWLPPPLVAWFTQVAQLLGQ